MKDCVSDNDLSALSVLAAAIHKGHVPMMMLQETWDDILPRLDPLPRRAAELMFGIEMSREDSDFEIRARELMAEVVDLLTVEEA